MFFSDRSICHSMVFSEYDFFPKAVLFRERCIRSSTICCDWTMVVLIKKYLFRDFRVTYIFFPQSQICLFHQLKHVIARTIRSGRRATIHIINKSFKLSMTYYFTFGLEEYQSQVRWRIIFQIFTRQFWPWVAVKYTFPMLSNFL